MRRKQHPRIRSPFVPNILDLLPTTDHVFDTPNRFNADYIAEHGRPWEGDVIHIRPHPGDIPSKKKGVVVHMCTMYPWSPARPN